MRIPILCTSLAVGFSIAAISCLSENNIRQNENEAEWIKFLDDNTGNEVWQITTHDSKSEVFYFYAQSFTSDDKYAVYRSRRSGNWEVWRCDLTSGKLMQLTSEGISSACIHPDGKNLAYISGWKYYTMNVQTGKKQLLLDFTGKIPAQPGFRPTFTNDGRYTLITTRQNNIHSIFRVDLETKEIVRVHEQDTGSFSHALINPANPDLITYVPLPDTQNDMDLPMQNRARTRLIRSDEGTDKPFLIAPYGFRATHDSWSPSGDRFFFFEKKVPGWAPVSIASIDLAGSNYTRHHSNDSIKLGHGTVSMDGEWFISDGQQPDHNPLILLNLHDGKTKTLCWPDASISTPANVHVHPNFSSSGNYIIFTSDKEKRDIHQVYIIPVKKIKDQW